MNADTAPMKLTPATLGAWSAVLLSVALAPSCSRGSSEPDPTPAAPEGASQAPEKVSEPHGKTFEELVGVQRPAEVVQDEQTLPTLGFQSNSLGLPDSGTWREHPTLADLNGDGKDDLIATNREEDGLNIWLSVPGEAWVPHRKGVPDDLMYGGSDCADLDGDGDVDILLAAHKLGLHTLFNEGDEGWRVDSEPAEHPFLSLDVVLGNFNGDEHLDAATIPQFVTKRRGALGLYFGLGDGTFEYQDQLRDTTGKSRNGVQVEVADLDGDGLDDLFLAAEWSCLVLLPRIADDGVVRIEDRSAGLPGPPTNMGNTLRGLVPFDVEGDGQLEVAFVCLSDMQPRNEPTLNTLGVLRWNEEEETWQQFGSGLPNGRAYTDVMPADFNGDGKSDLVVVGPGLGAVLYLGDGEGNFEAKGMFEGTLAGGRGAIGDIDGDGKPDLALINSDSKYRPDAGSVMTFLNRDSAW